MVGNNQRDFAAQFTTLVPIEEILQAVVVLRNENGNARSVGGMGEPPIHLEFAGNRLEALGELRQVKIKIGRIELDTRQKKIRFLISMLIGEKDISVVAKNEFGNRSDHTFAIRTGDQEDGGIMH
jgi:hypothetical protein